MGVKSHLREYRTITKIDSPLMMEPKQKQKHYAKCLQTPPPLLSKQKAQAAISIETHQRIFTIRTPYQKGIELNPVEADSAGE